MDTHGKCTFLQQQSSVRIPCTGQHVVTLKPHHNVSPDGLQYNVFSVLKHYVIKTCRGDRSKALYVFNHSISSSKVMNLKLWSVGSWYPWDWKLHVCQSHLGHFHKQGTPKTNLFSWVIPWDCQYQRAGSVKQCHGWTGKNQEVVTCNHANFLQLPIETEENNGGDSSSFPDQIQIRHHVNTSLASYCCAKLLSPIIKTWWYNHRHFHHVCHYLPSSQLY